jgi:1-acyl-sn-glycerol-3-phosphate acyltransferase
MSIFAKAQNSFVAKFLRKIFKIEIINPENEPDISDISNSSESDLKSYIVCANHSSNWDPIIIGACMHKPLRYMAKAELFKVPGLKQLIKWFGAYPVNRNGADVSSIKMTINILEQGELVGMYPQGSRARGVHPKDITPKNGVAMIAVKAKTGILPVTIISKKYKVRIFRKTIIIFGRYMPYDEFIQENPENQENGSGRDEPKIKVNENMSLYKKVTDKVYAEILANYEKYDILNKK